MGINYEVAYWVMIVPVGFIIILIWQMFKEIDELRGRINVAVVNIREDIIKTRCMIDKVNENLLNFWDDWCDEGEEFEEEDELEPGEVETRGELTIEIEEDPIHLITPNQFFFENNGHSQFKLEYASDCDELRFYYNDFSDEHIVIDNIDQCIGEGLKFFGVNSRNDDVVYVRNNIFNADFMITKVS